MPETIDTTPSTGNRNCSDSEDGPVPILDDESEQLRLRIIEVVGKRKVRSFADSAGIGATSLRNYMDGVRKPKRPAIEKIAFEGRVSADWLATGQGQRQRQMMSQRSGSRLQAMQYMTGGDDPIPDGKINSDLLRMCLQACYCVHGDDFAKSLVPIQLIYAADFYNQLAALANSKGPQASVDDFCRLDATALADQLRFFLQMGWARKFPYESDLSGTW